MFMNREAYVAAEMEVVHFDTEDILTTSGVDGVEEVLPKN